MAAVVFNFFEVRESTEVKDRKGMEDFFDHFSEYYVWVSEYSCDNYKVIVSFHYKLL